MNRIAQSYSDLASTDAPANSTGTGTQHHGKALVPPTRRARILGAVGSRLSVGKTSTVINLAMALQADGKRTLIIDVDASDVNIPTLLSLPVLGTWKNVCEGEHPLSEALIKGPEGIYVLPVCRNPSELDELDEGQQAILASQLDALRQAYDFIFVDCALRTEKPFCFFNQLVHEVIVVADGDAGSVMDAYTVMEDFHLHRDINQYYLVLNRVRSEDEVDNAWQKLASSVELFFGGSIHFLGWVPHDSRLERAALYRKAVLDLFPFTPASHAFRAIKQNLLDMSPIVDASQMSVEGCP